MVNLDMIILKYFNGIYSINPTRQSDYKSRC